MCEKLKGHDGEKLDGPLRKTLISLMARHREAAGRGKIMDVEQRKS